MGEIIKIGNNSDLEKVNDEVELVELTEGLLQEARETIKKNEVLSVPISGLATLGTGVAALLPALNKLTGSNETLYRLANAAVGDSLKLAKNGNFWGAFHTATGGSKFAQLQAVSPLTTSTQQAAAAINPATLMMAVALFSIEKELKQISETGKQILQFLEVEKEAEIEADVEILMNIISKYKMNWDNKHFVSSNHKLVLDIQRTARKNMNAYQKKVDEVLKSKQFIVAQNKVNSTLADLEKKFQYYRLSLYTFSLASMMEIMLSGNFKEEYVTGIKEDIKLMSDTYKELFDECSFKLEKMGKSALEANIVKGLGTAGKAMGKLIGSIPIVKDGSVDEFLLDKGDNLQKNAQSMEQKAVKTFKTIGDPGTKVFVEKMEDIVQIYNYTEQICFDNEKIYLLA